MARSVLERFEDSFIPEPNSGCWLWIGSEAGKGYGRFMVGARRTSAHRMSWELYRGPIPGDLWVLHKCDVRFCVNPDHLFLGTSADNIHDMLQKQRGAYGEKHAKAKFNRDQVEEIRASSLTNVELSRRFGVTPAAVSAVRTRRNWNTEHWALAVPSNSGGE